MKSMWDTIEDWRRRRKGVIWSRGGGARWEQVQVPAMKNRYCIHLLHHHPMLQRFERISSASHAVTVFLSLVFNTTNGRLEPCFVKGECIINWKILSLVTCSMWPYITISMLYAVLNNDTHSKHVKKTLRAKSFPCLFLSVLLSIRQSISNSLNFGQLR